MPRGGGMASEPSCAPARRAAVFIALVAGVAVEFIKEGKRPPASVRGVLEASLDGSRVTGVRGAEQPEGAQQRTVHVRDRPAAACGHDGEQTGKPLSLEGGKGWARRRGLHCAGDGLWWDSRNQRVQVRHACAAPLKSTTMTVLAFA